MTKVSREAFIWIAKSKIVRIVRIVHKAKIEMVFFISSITGTVAGSILTFQRSREHFGTPEA